MVAFVFFCNGMDCEREAESFHNRKGEGWMCQGMAFVLKKSENGSNENKFFICVLL